MYISRDRLNIYKRFGRICSIEGLNCCHGLTSVDNDCPCRLHDQGVALMTYRVTFIPGDGVGPELSEATRRVLEATGVAFDWDVQDAGVDVMDKYGTPLPEHVLESIRANKIAIKGPITTPVGTGFRSVNVALRKELDLYCCLRPCK